jgi:hypothetical protein
METNLSALGNVRTATLLRNRKKDLLIESCVIEYALHYDHQWRKKVLTHVDLDVQNIFVREDWSVTGILRTLLF